MATSPPALTALDTSAPTATANPTPSADEGLQSPSLSTPSARARFEFENGRGNEGTKVLMVEWEDDSVTRQINGAWSVTWEGKPADVMPVSETAEERITIDDDSAPPTACSDMSIRQSSHRLYFLLGAQKSVPATVTLTLTSIDGKDKAVVWKTNPLPAIFPKSLADPKSQGTKGVLHGIWAEKRLAKLQKEIEEEAKTNCEGVALHMAITEKTWIENTYGLAPKPKSLALNTTMSSLACGPRSPSSPLSPGGTRLSEKLKGLRLQTNEAKPVQVVIQPRAVPIMPEQAGEPSRTTSEVQSIGAVLSGQHPVSAPVQQDHEEEELFALPLSPRSPEMTKSPFSFAAEDTRGYLSKQTVGV